MDELLPEYYSSEAKNAIGRRIAATIFDYLLLFLVSIVYVVAVGEKTERGYHARGWAGSVPLLLWVMYFIVFESLFARTLGKKLMGIRVVSLNADKLNFGQVIKRRAADIIEIWWCLGLIALILIRNTEYHQRLGDLWAKTVVIRAIKKEKTLQDH